MIDLVIVISDNIKKLDKGFNIHQYKEKKIPIYIVTGNLDTNNIVDAINLTKYTSYIKNSSERIIKKALSIVSLNEKK